MKCPLFRIAAVIQPGGYAKGAFDCLKEECGQWDKEGDGCSELTKAELLRSISYWLQCIHEKLTPELFRAR